MANSTYTTDRYSRAIPLLLWLMSIPCAAADVESQETAVIHAQVSAQCRIAVDIRRDERPACWRLLCGSSKALPLGCDLTQMHQVTSLSVSPDRQHLAVMSVGEGHPILELVDLARLVKRHEYSALCTVNPFPGTLDINGWDASVLLVASDVPLTLNDAEQRAGSISAEELHFRITAEGCAIKPAL